MCLGAQPSRIWPPGGSTRLRESASPYPFGVCWAERSPYWAGTQAAGPPLLPSFEGCSPSCPGAEDSCPTLSPSGQAGRNEESREGLRPAQGHSAGLWGSQVRTQSLCTQTQGRWGSQETWLGSCWGSSVRISPLQGSGLLEDVVNCLL